jgi:hypothetical protein
MGPLLRREEGSDYYWSLPLYCSVDFQRATRRYIPEDALHSSYHSIIRLFESHLWTVHAVWKWDWGEALRNTPYPFNPRTVKLTWHSDAGWRLPSFNFSCQSAGSLRCVSLWSGPSISFETSTEPPDYRSESPADRHSTDTGRGSTPDLYLSLIPILPWRIALLNLPLLKHTPNLVFLRARVAYNKCTLNTLKTEFLHNFI